MREFSLLQPLRDTAYCSLGRKPCSHKSVINVAFLSASVLIYPNKISVCPDITSLLQHRISGCFHNSIYLWLIVQWLQVPFLWSCPCSVVGEMSHGCQGSEMVCGRLYVTGYGWPSLERALGALRTCELVWRSSSVEMHSDFEKWGEKQREESRKVKRAKRVGGIKL